MREEFLGELSVFDNRVPDLFNNYYRLKNPNRRQPPDHLQYGTRRTGRPRCWARRPDRRPDCGRRCHPLGFHQAAGMAQLRAAALSPDRLLRPVEYARYPATARRRPPPPPPRLPALFGRLPARRRPGPIARLLHAHPRSLDTSRERPVGRGAGFLDHRRRRQGRLRRGRPRPNTPGLPNARYAPCSTGSVPGKPACFAAPKPPTAPSGMSCITTCIRPCSVVGRAITRKSGARAGAGARLPGRLLTLIALMVGGFYFLQSRRLEMRVAQLEERQLTRPWTSTRSARPPCRARH